MGMERAGLRCVWQVEINPFCRRVLSKHWPAVPKHDDVRTFPDGETSRWKAEVICGGFPCQDVSRAGLRAGIEGERTGLYRELLRVIRLLRPRYAILENVPGLLDGGLGTVLGDLAALGFDAEWSVLSACAVGAPHTRERVFVVAYPHGQHGQEGVGLQSNRPSEDERRHAEADTRRRVDAIAREGGVVDGFSAWVDRSERIKGLGNAVYPDAAEYIGRRLMAAEARLLG